MARVLIDRKLERLVWLCAAVAGLFCVAQIALLLVIPRLLYSPDPVGVAPTEDWISVRHILTDDGERLIGWEAEADPGCPVFLFFDGQAGRPHIQYGRWRRMHARGVGFLAISYRGYSGSSGSPDEAGLYLDGAAGYRWLISQGHSPTEIIAHGFSLGSAIAVDLASEKRLGALVLEAPFTSIGDVVGDHIPFTPAALSLRSLYPSIDKAHRITTPSLLVHGSADRLISPSHSEAFGEALAGPTQVTILPGSDHATLVRDGLYQPVWDFLVQNGFAHTCPGLRATP